MPGRPVCPNAAGPLTLAPLALTLLAPMLLVGPAAVAADPGAAASEGASALAPSPAASASPAAKPKASAKTAKSADKSADKSGAGSTQPAPRLATQPVPSAEAEAPAASPTPTGKAAGKETDKAAKDADKNAAKNADKGADKGGHADKRSPERNEADKQARGDDPVKADASRRPSTEGPAPSPSSSPSPATGPASPASLQPTPFARPPAAPVSSGGNETPTSAMALWSVLGGLVLAGLGGAWLWRRRAGLEAWNEHLTQPVTTPATDASPAPDPASFAALLAGAQDGQPVEPAEAPSAPTAGAAQAGTFQPLALRRDDPKDDSPWSTSTWGEGMRADDLPAQDGPMGRPIRNIDAPLAERFTPFFPEPAEEEAEAEPEVEPDALFPEEIVDPYPPEPPPPPPPAFDLLVDFQPTRFAANLGGVTLRYRLIIANQGDLATGPLSITADMLAAGPDDIDGDSPAMAHDPLEAVALPELYRLERLAVGDTLDLSGHFTLPRSHFTPISLGVAELLVPLVRIRVVAGQDDGAEIEGIETRAVVPAGTLVADSSFLVGEPPQAEADQAVGLRPFRIDLAPQIFPVVAGRRLRQFA